MSKLNAAILFGGRSNEHDVSVQSAKSVIKHISSDKYNIHLIGSFTMVTPMILKIGKAIPSQ